MRAWRAIVDLATPPDRRPAPCALGLKLDLHVKQESVEPETANPAATIESQLAVLSMVGVTAIVTPERLLDSILVFSYGGQDIPPLV